MNNFDKKSLSNTFVFILFFAFAKALIAQPYLDLIKVNYAAVPNVGYEGVTPTTTLNLADINATFPVKLSGKWAIVTGIDYAQDELSLFPNTPSSRLSKLTFKAGFSWKINKMWSTTVLALPKIASENLHTDGNHFFVGGVALVKLQKDQRHQYRFGIYSSQEGFGTIITPIVGLYYQSDQEKWEVTASFPVTADVNYKFNNEAIRLGLGYRAPVSSYSRSRNLAQNQYVQAVIIEAGPYIQHSFINETILLKFQAGYASTSYEVYQEGDTLPIRLVAFEFGDERNRLNPELNGNFFLRLGMSYRFHTNKTNPTN